MRPTKQEVIDTMGKEFLKVLEIRVYMLKKMGYSNKKIAELIQYKSKLKEFVRIIETINYSGKLEFFLNEIINEINEDSRIKIELCGKSTNPSLRDLKNLEKLLEKYIEIVFLNFPGLVREIKTIGNQTCINYFDLKVKYRSDFIKIFPYSEVHIIKDDKSFAVFAREDHPISKLIKKDNLLEMITKIEAIIHELEEKTKYYTKKDWLTGFVPILFNSIFAITYEIGLAGKIPQKVFENINHFIDRL